jgi:hypothetical protein
MLRGVSIARMMWTLYEPIHAVTYFSSEASAAFEAAGLRGFWRGYFAGRAAPLGPIGAAPVIGAFFSFAPDMVTRALPDVWQRAGPEVALRARLDGAVATLAKLTGDPDEIHLAEAAWLLESAAAQLEPAGRVLGAANAALPVPDEPLPRLWQAATTLREHRGDGHVAALVAAGVGPCEVLVWRAASDLRREHLQPARGWSDEAWDQATERLIARGWLDGEGRPTKVGTDAFAEIEAATDRAASGVWDGVDTDRARALLTPIAVACRATLPEVNPIGLPQPGAV